MHDRSNERERETEREREREREDSLRVASLNKLQQRRLASRTSANNKSRIIIARAYTGCPGREDGRDTRLDRDSG